VLTSTPAPAQMAATRAQQAPAESRPRREGYRHGRPGHPVRYSLMSAPHDACALMEPRIRIFRGAALEGQNGGILDDAIADFDSPPDGIVRGPCGRAAEHGLEVWQQGFADFPGGGVP
jgi:hypothetical protein